MAKFRIECSVDGPYLVEGVNRLNNARGEMLETKPVTALCRCGHSGRKPYCDGTHKRIGFSGKRLSDGKSDKRRNYVGKRVTIHDNRSICAHAGFCTDGLAAVFNGDRSPWIDPDGVSLDQIVAIIEKCPSGALSYSIDGVEHRDRQRPPSITVTSDGPYAVEGNPELVATTMADGASTEHMTLCRCGASKNKPFCDGSHWDIGFKDG
jgi:CDGSH-type Zn-finger protein